MSGSTSGVQTRIRDSHPEAIFIHCMAHKLNLVIKLLAEPLRCIYYTNNNKYLNYIHIFYTFLSTQHYNLYILNTTLLINQHD
jgi:hypothetical protein